MIKILNKGLSTYLETPPDKNRFGGFPQTYYILCEERLAAVLYYSFNNDCIELLGIDDFFEIPRLDTADALCRAALSAALEQGITKCIIKDESLKIRFPLWKTAADNIADVFKKEC